MYRTVTELTHDEINELKEAYFAELFYSDEDVLGDDITCGDDIPDAVIFEHYNGIDFVEEDFFCNTGLPF